MTDLHPMSRSSTYRLRLRKCPIDIVRADPDIDLGQ